MKYSPGIPNFLEEIYSLSHFLFSSFLCIYHGGSLSYLSLLFFGILHSDRYSFPFLLCLYLLSFSQLFVRPPQTTILPFCISLSWGWSCSLPLYNVMNLVYSSSGTLSMRTNPLSLFVTSLYNSEGFDLCHTWMIYLFSYFLQFKSEFCNEFMICTTVIFWSYFCWLYRASPFLAAKNMINLILVLTIWWCPCIVISCVVGRGHLLWPVYSLGKILLAFLLLHFCTPSPKLPVTSGISWLPTFAFQSPLMKKTPFFGLVPEGLIGHHRSIQLQLLWQ